MPVKKTESAKNTADLEKKVAELEKKLAELVAKLDLHEKESKKEHEEIKAKCDKCCAAKSSGSKDEECRQAVKAIARSLLIPRATVPDVSDL